MRFLIEAEAAASLEHPHVVRVFEFREQGRNSLLVMEYLAGGSLDLRFAKGRMPAGGRGTARQGRSRRRRRP